MTIRNKLYNFNTIQLIYEDKLYVILITLFIIELSVNKNFVNNATYFIDFPIKLMDSYFSRTAWL